MSCPTPGQSVDGSCLFDIIPKMDPHCRTIAQIRARKSNWVNWIRISNIFINYLETISSQVNDSKWSLKNNFRCH